VLRLGVLNIVNGVCETGIVCLWIWECYHKLFWEHIALVHGYTILGTQIFEFGTWLFESGNQLFESGTQLFVSGTRLLELGTQGALGTLHMHTCIVLYLCVLFS
jgi:hypothetical protein